MYLNTHLNLHMYPNVTLTVNCGCILVCLSVYDAVSGCLFADVQRRLSVEAVIYRYNTGVSSIRGTWQGSTAPSAYNWGMCY